jgi:uncharacterized membrane protein YciS (DUF1049 family)
MAVCKIDKIKPNATELLCILCLFVACIFLTIGGIFYTNDRYKVLNYVNAQCEVRNASWKAVVYVQTYSLILHYVPSWYLRYYGIVGAAQGNVQYKTYQEALAQAQKYQVKKQILLKKSIPLVVIFKVNSYYPCWYDKKNPTVAQWDKPNTRIASVLLGCGTILLVLAIGFLFLTHLLIRKTERNIAENNIAHIHVTFLK